MYRNRNGTDFTLIIPTGTFFLERIGFDARTGTVRNGTDLIADRTGTERFFIQPARNGTDITGTDIESNSVIAA